MPHSHHEIDHRGRRVDARQDRLKRSFGFLVHLGRRYAWLVALLALSALIVACLRGTPAARATSPISPVTGGSSGDVTSGSAFWSRIRAVLSWESPLPWFLVGLPALGLLSWGLLWGLSRLKASSWEIAESDQEAIGE